MLKEIFGNLLAGLGLFFIGVKFIGDHMKQMAGRGLRLLISRITRSPALSVVCGLVAGGLVQSTTAVTFIMTSLVSIRLITVRKAMPIIAWSNVGNSLFVLMAVLDLRILTLYLIGITGICFYFNLDKSNHFRDAVGTALGLGLLFLGLILMKAGAEPLTGIGWFREFLVYTRTSYLLAFFIGGFLTFVAQSATTVSIIAIAMAKIGLLGVDQTIMIIYGSNLGSGFSTAFMASNLRGTARQLAIFQAIFRVGGALLLLPLFYGEIYFHIPGIRYLTSHLASEPGRQMAYVFLMFQLSAVAVMSAAMTPVQRLLERLSPATEQEELTRTKFLYDQAIDEPETALDLAEKELSRLCHLFPEFLDAVREETAHRPTIGSDALGKAVHDVAAQVTGFITDLMDQHQSRGSLERAINLQNRTEIVISLADTLDELVTTAVRLGRSEKLSAFTQQLTEGLHFILTVVSNAAENPDETNRQTLFSLTADRGEMMERVRRRFLSGEASISPADQQSLLTITTLFERTIWLLRRFGTLLAPMDKP